MLDEIKRLFARDRNFAAFVRVFSRSVKIAVSLCLLAFAILIALKDLETEKYRTLLSEIAFAPFAWVGLPIALSFILAAVRLRIIAADLGYKLSFRQSVATVSAGQIGGLLFFQLIGQLVARGAYLSKLNIPMAGTIVITTNERIGAAFVSACLAVAGAIHIFQRLSFDLGAGGASFAHLAAGMAFACLACGIYWRHELLGHVKKLTARSIVRAALSLLMSMAVQLATMAAYVLAVHSLYPSLSFADSAASAALVMFAASIPISFAGWGVRELSAVAALSAVGMPTELSLLAAVLVGVLSIATSFIMAAMSIRRFTASTLKREPVQSEARLQYEKILGAVLPVLIAIFVFFQVHLPAEHGLFINVNLADPLAMVGGLLFAAVLISGRAAHWRVSGINMHIAACTAVVTLSLLIGAATIGWTQWAVANKYVGWFVLLSFGATGALAIGHIDLQKVLQTFAIAGCAVIVFELLSYFGAAFGILPSKYLAMGFAQNTNAFAFQCIMVFCVSLVLPKGQWIGMSLALTGIWLSQSRAGIGAVAVLLIVATIYVPGRMRLVVFSLVLAAMCSALVATVSSWAATCIQTGSLVCAKAVTPFAPQDSSTAEHISLAKQAVEMFLSNPVFGAGLGVFISRDNGPYPLAIHSTPLWLLAEFGVVGFLTFVVPLSRVFLNEMKRFRANDLAGNLLVLAITGFSAMSLFHEMLYQRAFWFLLGAALATAALPSKREAS